ncbi:hypothetical protein HYH02_004219 [Chlamydomonas schloesseri]|uniref:Homoserine dehydrogenase catalytic domain-containing protein n=1 Tax=Chlamydomonas schloesseri TaxID=2026947 RepID=A0A835WP64_9CHLO|nr:hypothetical protein HYH02_004219 [Chlamydomonas schloesseri]|eukprot:KAG2450947.1 hypothetical protein HYH02_004219 [Chlamydomonas schloesseri]
MSEDMSGLAAVTHILERHVLRFYYCCHDWPAPVAPDPLAANPADGVASSSGQHYGAQDGGDSMSSEEEEAEYEDVAALLASLNLEFGEGDSGDALPPPAAGASAGSRAAASSADGKQVGGNNTGAEKADAGGEDAGADGGGGNSGGGNSGGGNSGGAAGAAAARVRVGSWNVKKLTFTRAETHRRKLKHLARQIIESGAKIVALQEISSIEGVRYLCAQLDLLGRKTSLDTWRACVSTESLYVGGPAPGGVVEHAAIIYRASGPPGRSVIDEMRDPQGRSLCGQLWQHPGFLRSPLYALLSIRRRPVLFINCHLRQNGNAEVAALLKLVHAAEEQCHMPVHFWRQLTVVVLGDFNKEPRVAAMEHFVANGWQRGIPRELNTNVIDQNHYDDIFLKNMGVKEHAAGGFASLVNGIVWPLPAHLVALNNMNAAIAQYSDHLLADIRAAADPRRYAGVVDVGVVDAQNGKGSVELCRYPKSHPFAQLQGSDNIISFTTARYFKQPLIVRGPGAGADVMAAGVFSDLLRLAAYLGAPS